MEITLIYYGPLEGSTPTARSAANDWSGDKGRGRKGLLRRSTSSLRDGGRFSARRIAALQHGNRLLQSQTNNSRISTSCERCSLQHGVGRPKYISEEAKGCTMCRASLCLQQSDIVQAKTEVAASVTALKQNMSDKNNTNLNSGSSLQLR